MSDATYIELPPQKPKKRASFFKSWRGAVLGLFILAVILSGCFSWWLSEGKISSSYARVDTVVYTVEPEVPARLAEILVQQGQAVNAGQPLAIVDPEMNQQNSAPKPPSPAAEISGRLNATQENEKRMSTRLAQARAEEEKYRKLHQDRVTEHVGALLSLRALDPNTPFYEQASRMEASARARMNTALDEFEKVSKMRAATENELERIRYELARKRMRANRIDKTPPAPPAPVPAPELATLYAPVDGKIMGINARPGQFVMKGQPVFMIMPAANGQNAGTWIQAWFPVSAQSLLKLGQKANIKSGSLHLIGRVAAISPEAQYFPAENSGRSEYVQYLPVRIQVEDPEELSKLEPGAAVQCQIQTRYVIGEQMF